MKPQGIHLTVRVNHWLKFKIKIFRSDSQAQFEIIHALIVLINLVGDKISLTNDSLSFIKEPDLINWYMNYLESDLWIGPEHFNL